MPHNASIHPVERGERGRSLFDRFAQRASHVASSSWFFLLCAAMIAAWAAAYVLGADAEIRNFAGEAMTALTLLLVALLKNADLRSEAAIQLKLDAIATALAIQHEGDDPRPELREAVGLHDEL